MAHLLGDALCMESLQHDINDLQVSIIDISSRVGPINSHSWKYPDKKSCDLDITELLEVYTYAENEVEDTQVSHIVLYELVIDRLLLYIQLMNKYIDGLTTSGKDCGAAINTSVGIVTRKFWNRMIKLHSTIQQQKSEALQTTNRLLETERSLKKLQENSDNRAPRVTSLMTPPSPPTSQCTKNSPVQDISQDCCHRAAQTYKTAFLPCESCAVVQKNLRDIGERVIGMCKQHAIPSALQKFKPHVANIDWMTANEVSEWVSEQNKDFTRITKQFDSLNETVNTLKDEISRETARNKQLLSLVNKHNEEMKIEKENQVAFRKHVDNEVVVKRKEYMEHIAAVTREKEEVVTLKKGLESQLKRIECELEKQTSTLNSLEHAKSELESELSEVRVEARHVSELESRVCELTTHLRDVTDDVATARKDLLREQAKNKSAEKYQQNVKSKHESLIRRVEELDHDSEELRGELIDLEGERDDIRGQLEVTQSELVALRKESAKDKEIIEVMNQEKESLLQSITQIEALKDELKAKVAQAEERDRLLVEYPDLNGPVRQNTEGSGDIAEEMKNQISANEVRIDLLEKQNVALRATITKMVDSHQNRSHVWQVDKPTPLWNHTKSEPVQLEDARYHDRPIDYKTEWSHTEATVTSSKKPPLSHPPRSYAPSTSPSNASTPINRTNNPSAGDLSYSVVGQVIGGNKVTNKRAKSRCGTASKGSLGEAVYVPKSHDTRNSGDDAAVRAYVQMKKTMSITTDSSHLKTTSTMRQPPPSHIQGTQSLACPRCDKLYNSKKDLEIHSVYCYGKPRVFVLNDNLS